MSVTFETVINVLFGTGLFINALLFVPQAIRIIRLADASDISLVTFIGFCITQLLAIIYGYLHNDWVLMIGYIFSLLTCGCVTILVMFYRLRKQVVS